MRVGCYLPDIWNGVVRLEAPRRGSGGRMLMGATFGSLHKAL